jgi:DMSO/TMAO reductase YedYZ molybdopterin-dependent catalytic subunit
MRRRFFQAFLLVIILWLMWFGSLSRVSGTDSSGARRYTLTVDSGWRLLVDGGVQHPVNLTFDELLAMPRSTVSAELDCPGFFVIDGNWTGVKLGLVLEKAGFDPNATLVKFFAQDGYEVSLSMGDAMRGDVIIAYEKDGEPLPETTRLVIPGTIGSQWISKITQIVLPTSVEEFPIAVPVAILVIAVATTTLYVVRKGKRSRNIDKATSL